MGDKDSVPKGILNSSDLLNWNKFDPETLKKRRLIFLYNATWPQYKLGDGESGPENESLKHNTILQSDLF